MSTFFTKPTVQKTLRFTLAYVLFALFALFGLVVIFNLHNAIFRISLMATTRIGVSNFVYVGSGFLLFAGYVFAIVLLESMMNKAARTGQLRRVSVRVFAVEAGLALLAWLMPIAARLVLLPG